MSSLESYLIAALGIAVLIIVVLSFEITLQKLKLTENKVLIDKQDAFILRKNEAIQHFKQRLEEETQKSKVPHLAAEYLAFVNVLRLLDKFASKHPPIEFNYNNLKKYLSRYRVFSLAQYQSAIKNKENQ